MTFSLAQAIDVYKAATDSAHKTWAYFQAVLAGAAAFSWTGEDARSATVLWLLTIAVIVFSVLNGRLPWHFKRFLAWQPTPSTSIGTSTAMK